jgi:hypothetical protein
MPGDERYVDDFSHDIGYGGHVLLRHLQQAFADLGIECTVCYEGGLVRVHFPEVLNSYDDPPHELDLEIAPKFGAD